MSLRFNPFTGTFDFVGISSGGSIEFDSNRILTANVNTLLTETGDPVMMIITDEFGNVLISEA